MTENTATLTFLDRLRSETTEAHTALERIPVSAAILKTSVTDAQYAAYLRLMYDVVASVEKHVHPHISHVISDLEDRVKSIDLRNDLVHIGHEAPGTAKNPFQDMPNPGFALGVAYVVEGSTLGGRFILKNIESVLGYNEHAGASYFSGYGNKTGSMWKSFLAQMTAFAAADTCEDDIVAGANHAFKAIHDHLDAL